MSACPACGGEQPPVSLRCLQCGSRQAAPCASCGQACEADFAFCPRCGAAREPGAPAAVEAAHLRADRRIVTVVFADLAGFTTLAEQLDPELLRSFQAALFETLARPVARYDGFVEKFVGDAVLAVFGAPRAHEDDAVRALEASREMMQGVDRLSLAWAGPLGREVGLHIGVHTGPVVAGHFAAAAGGAYAVTGDTVNTAARLLAGAEAGAVLVSESTQRLVQHRYAFGPAQALGLRGKAQPVRVSALAGVRADAASARGLAELGLAAPLVGRAAALETLLEAFERMQRGRAQCIAIVGEAGAGKSRLLAELYARLGEGEAGGRLAGVALRRAVCSPLGEPTYGSFAALFREAYGIEAGDALDVARAKLQDGLRALGGDADEVDAAAQVVGLLLGIPDERPRDIEPEQLQRQITLAARALIERRTARQPVLMVVDDVQWADAASIDLLGQVVDALAERPLMLLLAQRPGARALALQRVEQATLELAPLGESEVRALVGHLLGEPAERQRAAPEAAGLAAGLGAVFDLVAARAGGNPLFVEEMVRSLAGGGQLTRRGERWVCDALPAQADVPATLHGLLLARIDALPAEDRRTLQAAAVLGDPFETPLLQRISADGALAAEALPRLAEAGLIRAEAGAVPRWRFAHALLHDVVYQNLLRAQRSELHRRAGQALEAALGAEGGGLQRLAVLESLGHHWSLSPDKLRGAQHLLAAGDWARALYANDDAMRHYERALHTLAELPAVGGDAARPIESARLDAAERLADLKALQGQRADALAGYERVRAALDGRCDAPRGARVLRKIGGLAWEAGERERAAACFEAGLACLGEAGDAVERAQLFQEMGRLAFRAGDNARALVLAERALAELPAHAAHESTVARVQAGNTLGVALARLGRLEEAVEQIERSVEQAEAHGLLQAACRGYTNLGVLYASLDPRRSIATCLRGLETARKVGDLGLQSHLYANLAAAYCALTNRCEAEGVEAAQAAVSLDRRLGLLDHLAVPLIVLGQIHQCHGEPERAFDAYREALALAERIDEPQLLFPCYDGLATLYLDSGSPAEAEAHFAKAQAVCERAGLQPDALMVLPFLC